MVCLETCWVFYNSLCLLDFHWKSPWLLDFHWKSPWLLYHPSFLFLSNQDFNVTSERCVNTKMLIGEANGHYKPPQTQVPVFTKLFQVQDQDRAQVSKWIISGLFSVIYSRKLNLCIHWHGKCFRPKMHKIKVHVGDN